MAGLAGLRLGVSDDEELPASNITPAHSLRFQRLRRDPEGFAIVRAVARMRKVPLRSLLNRSRGTSRTSSARQLAMYLIHVLLRRPQDSVGVLFGRDPSTVCHACKVVEDLRDNPPLEIEIVHVEESLGVVGEQRHVA
jgi:Bacterial dnaA protein helix-turn-helix